MDALVVRLSQLDAEAEGAMRVVMFYDTLIRRRVDLPALARASAGLAECVVGIRLHGTGQVTRFAPDGRQAPTPQGSASTEAAITLDDEQIGTVWLERTGPSRSLDELLLERLAIAVAAVVERYGPASTTMADPALVELAIGADSDEAVVVGGSHRPALRNRPPTGCPLRRIGCGGSARAGAPGCRTGQRRRGRDRPNSR